MLQRARGCLHPAGGPDQFDPRDQQRVDPVVADHPSAVGTDLFEGGICVERRLERGQTRTSGLDLSVEGYAVGAGDQWSGVQVRLCRPQAREAPGDGGVAGLLGSVDTAGLGAGQAR